MKTYSISRLDLLRIADKITKQLTFEERKLAFKTAWKTNSIAVGAYELEGTECFFKQANLLDTYDKHIHTYYMDYTLDILLLGHPAKDEEESKYIVNIK